MAILRNIIVSLHTNNEETINKYDRKNNIRSGCSEASARTATLLRGYKEPLRPPC